MAALAVAACAPGASPELLEPTVDAVSAQPIVWTEGQQLSGQPSILRFFGNSVALSADMAVVGASGTTHVGKPGAAYVFPREGSGFGAPVTLVTTDGSPEDSFGSSLALSGNTVVVGAAADGEVAADGGAAYVFVRSGGEWQEQKKLFPKGLETGDHFGHACAIEGDVAVVGADGDDNDHGEDAGSVYVFERTGDAWTQTDTLTASDGEPGDRFGVSVALSGDTLLIGAAFGDSVEVTDSGSAYVFARRGSGWVEAAKRTASNASVAAGFGRAVALSGDTAVVGADFALAQGSEANNAGLAYVFVREGGTWTEQATLQKDAPVKLDRFGISVRVSGDVAVVGASRDDAAANDAGGAYVFVRAGAAWEQRQALFAPIPKSGDLFGGAVALSRDMILVGTPRADAPFENSGAAFTFALRFEDGAPCASAGGCLSGHCVDGVCCDTECRGSCDVCAASLGASVDGICTYADGYEGNPSCGEYVCLGTGPVCPVSCTSDEACAPAHFCTEDFTCEPRRPEGSGGAGGSGGGSGGVGGGGSSGVGGSGVGGSGGATGSGGAGGCDAAAAGCPTGPEDDGPKLRSYYSCAAAPDGGARSRFPLATLALLPLASLIAVRRRRACQSRL